MLKLTNFKNSIMPILIVIFTVFSLNLELKIIEDRGVSQYIVAIIGFLIFLVMNVKQRLAFRIKNINILFIFIFIFILLNSIAVRGETLLGAIFILFVSVSIAKLLNYKSEKVNFKIYLFPFWMLSGYIVLALSVDPDPNHVFIRSRNYISFYLILTILPYYFLNFKKMNEASIIPSIVLLALSVYSFSRSGTAASLLIFIAALLSKNNKIRYFLSICALFLVIIFFSSLDLGVLLFRFSDLFESLESGARSTIWQNYMANMDFYDFIFGVDLTDNKILNFGGEYIPSHAHSSILNFLSVTGVIFYLFIYYVIITSMRLYKISWSLLLIFFAVLLRVMTESGALFGYFDYVIWMFFLIQKKDLNAFR
mgnify:CR=1 FL=1